MAAQESSYDENALRVVSRHGNMQILRGIRRARSWPAAGYFTAPRLAHLVSQSENALAEAKIFERDYDPGQWLLGLGIVSLGARSGRPASPTSIRRFQVGLAATTFVSMGYGAKKLHSAYEALSKAIWWYNRDLEEVGERLCSHQLLDRL